MTVSIAIIGLNGALGQAILEAVQTIVADKIKFPIKALTTTPGRSSTDKVEYIVTKYTDHENVASSLKGVDVIVDVASVDPDATQNIDKIVSLVKPKLYIPSQFGVEIPRVDKYFPGFLSAKTARSKAARDKGIKTVDIVTSFFAKPDSFLYEYVQLAGINTDSKKVTVIGSLDDKFAFSNTNDIGKAVASIAVQDPSSLPDTIRIQSGTVSYKEVKERWEKTHSEKLSIEKTHTKEEALKEAKAKYDKGFSFDDFEYYLHVIGAQGVDQGAAFSKNEDDIVNPGEKLWKWSKY